MSAIVIYPSTVTVVTYVSASPTALMGSAVASSLSSSSSSSPSTSTITSVVAAAAGAAAESTGMDTDELVVYWLDIALLCVLALFFLAALPRAVARFAQFSEWKRGQLFYGGSSAKRRTPVRPPSPAERLRRQYTDVTLWDYTTDQSHTLAMHGYSLEKGGKNISSFRDSGLASPPAHVPSFSTILYPVSSIFAYSVAPGKSVGKLTIAALFVAVIVILSFVLDGNPLTDPVRVGWFATGLIPVTIALATKNNLIGMLVGMGYERLNFLHRWVGIVSFVTANLHAIGYIYKWAIKDTLSESFQKPFIIHGTISLVGIELLYFASLGWVRNKAYNLFLFSHILGYLLFLFALCFHEAACIKWVVLGACIYALDHLMRVVKTRVCTARVKTVPELGLVRLEVPAIRSGWRAGQHVRLRVLSAEMGVVGWSVAHPFTIANASDSAEGMGMVLLVKKAGAWTGRLYDAAGRAGYYPVESGFGTVREMRVVVEGPYGGLGNMMMTSFSSAMLVGGGSGVTFVLSQAEELVQAVRTGKSVLKFIEIVWITQDQASITPLLPNFSALLEAVSPLPGIILKISIFYSRAASPSPPSSPSPSSSSSSIAAYVSVHAPSLSVYPGRPTLPRILDGLVRLTSALGIERAKGVALGVCGPVELVEDVRRAERGIDKERRSMCGGVEVHEEAFGW